MQVIKEKKEIFERNYSDGALPSPSLSQIIADDFEESQLQQKPATKKSSTPAAEGLRDDLDDIDENDIGEFALGLVCCVNSWMENNSFFVGRRETASGILRPDDRDIKERSEFE